jgi:hypothetical protein
LAPQGLIWNLKSGTQSCLLLESLGSHRIPEIVKAMATPAERGRVAVKNPVGHFLLDIRHMQVILRHTNDKKLWAVGDFFTTELFLLILR